MGESPQLLIKVPGTPEGLNAFESLTRIGINVNVTLLFRLHKPKRRSDAYLRGLSARTRAGADVRACHAVASLFLSRVDTLVDTKLTAIGTQEALVVARPRGSGDGQARLSTLSEDFSRRSLRRAGAQAQRRKPCCGRAAASRTPITTTCCTSNR